MNDNECIQEMAKIIDDARCITDMTREACRAESHLGNSCAVCKAKRLYSKGYHKAKWISVEERLPSETEGYLVVLDNEDIDIRLFNSKNDRHVTYYSMLNKFLFLDNRGDWHTEDRVTHWMPLPELPSGAESEEQNDEQE